MEEECRSACVYIPVYVRALVRRCRATALETRGNMAGRWVRCGVGICDSHLDGWIHAGFTVRMSLVGYKERW